ncbi:uncharacterized protein ACLA_013810 [Aspergillus clavatus NRRL 1]|uniref:UBL3-like ubiquitin domain-containing protein n=1 Tax=Aspergillus clavatus (strain ATCC 1007 / CBS 513.65 / DSM 816 / NCTC 3887 / NRRL 1 / QM 1276 / 107) TaxID=344612 RepID=A1CB26_ASPCL|nr:uncharacterized protein ACLA_013810 [Aspergillus clavatus NRRL 1]EAW12944.1 conserved hypothetical protein [Aspergillus clavatus NRRL 1]
MSSNGPPHLDLTLPSSDKDGSSFAPFDIPQETFQPSQSTTMPSSEPVEPTLASPHPEHTEPIDTAANIPTSGNKDNTAPAPTVEQSPTDAAPTDHETSAKVGLESTEASAPEPSSDLSDALAKEVEHTGPSLTITLLLTTGSRHPFEIDGNYLQKRGVNVENHDPFAMSVYTLKELIWKEWRQDWETRPTSPSSIRLISFGKLLDDKSPLSDCKFNKDAPNVVHMTVKPQEIVDEEDAKGAKGTYQGEREASERSPGCRCIIQ